MRLIDIIASFEVEINKYDDAAEKPDTENSLYWLNQAQLKFVKERFNGNLPKRTSYEQNEKRTRDLINLWKEDRVIDTQSDNSDASYYTVDLISEDEISLTGDVDENTIQIIGAVDDDVLTPEATGSDDSDKDSVFIIDKTHYDYNSYEYSYPKDMMFVLNENVVISNTENEHKKDIGVFECTADNFMYRINNSLTDFHYKHHTARPLRIRTNNGFRLLTDKNYKIHSYTLEYIKTPVVLTNENPEEEYKDFPEYIWPEIIKIAALMYIENQSDTRYRTLTNEVLTQE